MIDKISKKIRALRKSKDLTLKDLSEKTELSISFLSQVERGDSTLAITSLKKIANALEVPITYFFNNPEEHHFLVKKEDRKPFQMDGCQSLLSRLSGTFPNRVLESMIVTLHPNSNHGHSFNHPGEEFVYVIEGELTITLDDEIFSLKKDDSIHYPSTKNHLWQNKTNKETKILTINTPAIF
ncbi:MAG TPA: cupin domain-containing protein [Clostridia bacterium]|nr:cupin domain-containing protein [Clostridia bacterium]